MGYSQYDAAGHGRAAWNAGKKVGTKRPLTIRQIWAIRFFLDRERRVRDRALFDLAIDSKLAAATWLRSRLAIWLRARKFGRVRLSCSRRQVARFSSS